ncbi:hypothetical protein PN488_17765 [Nodularia spumigena CS-591/12]|uniref:Uncharacterized protein n=1 Tax=Nodularia spumigena CENA596 TaxID=1819295 RepID=A0A166K5A3_NODSP|nr:hypothetical protein [Nodularia spumigena]KZL50587.1 hypothetical protein A2T98_06885 [Nodularia spumigena CENA596]MDB9306195.1 hypothetical protein [Nodularia spumigena CS-591/12]MDB9347680.1 hypothetical protein [Nodularia spumigena CS-588/01]MDB9353271.1 hypothetical protein [Nodularia spumigena CS-588/05]
MSKNLVEHPEISEDNSQQDATLELELAVFISKFKTGIWLLGIPAWIFRIADKSLDAFANGYLSSVEFFHLLTTSLFFLSWLYLKPDIKHHPSQGNLCPMQTNKFALKKRHMISQEYILPFPYLCQIYHLLNLKHLETVHNFSLNNLKILNVSYFQPTNIGGIIKFQTILDSPANPLRIWRKPIVEVDLILHTPYTIELSIPVYNNKRIVVIFQAFPLNDKEHQLFIDIYSDLNWPKPLLQILLHFASCLTLFEDLPYLRNLADTNVERLFKLGKFSNNASMLLFQRFVELYGTNGNTHKLIEENN